MKKILFIYLALYLPSIQLYSQFIEIPDTNFLNALIAQGVDQDGDQQISAQEAALTSILDLQYKDITSLEGINAFTNLISLNCGNNKIDSLDVSGCIQLSELFCYVNQLRSLNVSNNTGLSTLYCGANQLSEIDVSSCAELTDLTCFDNSLSSLDLSGNPKLKVLNCEGNLLSKLEVDDNPELMVIYCTGNQLDSLVLTNNVALQDLTCGANQLTHLDLSQNPLLEALYCSGNLLETLDATNNPQLRQLYCDYNEIRNIELSNNPLLETLYCGNNLLSYLDISLNSELNQANSTPGKDFLDISYMTTLERVCVWELPFPSALNEQGVNTTGSPNIAFDTICGGNKVFIPDPNFLAALIEDSIDVNRDAFISYLEAEAIGKLYVENKNISDLTGINAFKFIDSLDCSDNDISELQIEKPDELIFLDCHNNRLNTLDVSSCSKLQVLYCYDNQLSSLDISGNTELRILLCAFNNIASLDLISNTALSYLSCSFNQLDELDISANGNLVRLWCNSNTLAELDVSKNTSLAALVCSNNQLMALDLSTNLSLVVLDCRNNSISSLDLQHNTVLGHLDCSANELDSLDITNNQELMIQKNPDYTYGFNLILSDMPTLKTVCVWSIPFPGEEHASSVDISGSPNLEFSDCNSSSIGTKGNMLPGNRNIRIYPNPADGLFTFEADTPLAVEVEIFNSTGKRAYRGEIKHTRESIDLRTCPPGIYIVRIRQENTFQTRKIVIR